MSSDERIVFWPSLNAEQQTLALARPAAAALAPEPVLAMMKKVDLEGLAAVHEFCQRFDGWTPQADNPLTLPPAEWPAQVAALAPALKTAIDRAYRHISKFHQPQGLAGYQKSNAPGLWCERRVRALQRVGLYIPAGSAPLFSTMLMLGVPAQLAGVDQLVVCSPSPQGRLPHPALLYAAQLCGVSEFYRLGGVQAITAMAGGGQLMAPVNKIFGPGNAYVTMAKQLLGQLFPRVAIDMPAGPSELMIVAAADAEPRYLAADMLSQAEHDPLSQVILISPQRQLLVQTAAELERQSVSLPRAKIVGQALQHSRLIQTADFDQALAIVNHYGPEHLSLAASGGQLEQLLEQVKIAGSVFLGHLTAEAFGDYLSGTNHVLPTSGYAHSYSGVSLEAFQRSFTVQQVSAVALRDLAATVTCMAQAEGLAAHAQAVEIRLHDQRGRDETESC